MILLLGLTLAPPGIASDDVTFDLYGELDLSYQVNQGADDEWLSNTSRIGLKGSAPLLPKTRLVYRFEQEFDPVHGGTSRDTLFKMRNTFIGLENDRFGRILVGAHDTPHKRAQGRVDQFNNQLGDIKFLLVGETRVRDVVFYGSPRFGAFSASALYVPADDDFDASQSVALYWQRRRWSAALAVENDMRKNYTPVSSTLAYDSIRGSLHGNVGDWSLGVLAQRSRAIESNNWRHGVIVSGERQFGDWTLDLQWGRSRMAASDRSQTLLGLSRRVGMFRWYGILSYRDGNSSHTMAMAVGAEYRFRVDSS